MGGENLVVIFENKNIEDANKRIIGTAQTQDGAYKIIFSFLKSHDYRHHYMIVNDIDGGVWIDVGSHSEFFYIVVKETAEKMLKGETNEKTI